MKSTFRSKIPTLHTLVRTTVNHFPAYIHKFQTGILVLLTIETLLAIGLFYIVVINKDRTFPGLQVLGLDVGFKTKDEIMLMLAANNRFAVTPYRIGTGDKIYTVTPAEIGLSLDAEKTATVLVQNGKNTTIVSTMKALYAALTASNLNRVYLRTDKAKLDSFLTKVDMETHREPTLPKITFTDNHPYISNAEEGRKLDKLGTIETLTEAIVTGSPRPVQAEFTPLGTKVTEANKQQWLDKLSKITQTDFTITYNTRKKIVSKEAVTAMMTLESVQPIPLFDISIAGKALSVAKPVVNQSAEFKLNTNEVAGLVQKIKSEIDQNPIDGRFNFDGERVTAFTASQDGMELDGEKAKKDIATALMAGQPVLELAVTITKAKVDTGSVNNLGIKELIGQGVSRYTGSGEGRTFNLTLGSTRLNGVLVPPGETFSMYKALGDVEGTTGYKEAYVIVNGRTEVGVGGGVCQVSTTMFRAALNAGLPIVERHPHAYRVSYYENGSSPGLDASVYFPESDFRFKNDTANYILIQTKVDPRSSTLTYNIYGTKDGREVALSAPTVSNVRAAPPPLYQDDPTLPVGAVKQVDFAAIGANASFNRVVKRDGVVVAQDTFYSSYQPWQAIYLKGTKTS